VSDIAVVRETFADDDQRWLGSAHGVENGRTITLDGSTFTGVWTDGRVPSGVCLGKITAAGADQGKYGLYDSGSSEVQSIIATGGTVGTFTITVAGETTAAIEFDATAAEVQAALEALSNVNVGDIVVAGGPLPETAVTLTYQGQFAGENVPAATIADSITNGSATLTTTTEGAAGAATNGLETFVGHLLTPARVINSAAATHDVTGALFLHGTVVESFLPTGHGLDAAAKEDAKGRIIYL
jgi:hypothetical protein